MRSWSNYGEQARLVRQAISQEEIDSVILLILETRASHKKILICGNGGSSSTAEHFAADLGVGSQLRGTGYSAISLSSNSSVITALGNDKNFEEIFAIQVDLYGEEGDLLFVVSASGQSKNLVRAIEVAKERSMKTVAFLGFDGGSILNIVDFALHAKTSLGEYGLVEDVHLSLSHYITERVRLGA